MKKSILFALTSASFAVLPAGAEVDCLAKSLFVKQSIATDQSKLLEIVSNEVAAAPKCACETVKSAIEASKANIKTVATIVEAAAIAAPEQMRLIAQCAVAVAPDALGEVQAVLAKLDPNLGESGVSAKGSKAAAVDETAAAPNPLDFPGQVPVGPIPGGHPGYPIIPDRPPVTPPVRPPSINPVIAPPTVSEENFPPASKVNP